MPPWPTRTTTRWIDSRLSGQRRLKVPRGARRRFIEGYGLPETSGPACFDRPVARTQGRFVGTPIDGVQMRVVDAHATEVPTGAPGEIQVRGRNVMKGYWNLPEVTADDIVDGWFSTLGDIGRVDEDGYFFVSPARTSDRRIDADRGAVARAQSGITTRKRTRRAVAATNLRSMIMSGRTMPGGNQAPTITLGGLRRPKGRTVGDEPALRR